MQHSVILSGDSKSEMELLIELAKKLGIKIKILSKEEKEDAGLLYLMNTGKTGKTVDTDKFLKSLRK
ncbi:MAG: hypothetical protein H3C31_03120 [Brumimicrobium sp.]|nr:hypothetical protein [Brumimicrobium sp.]